MATEITREEIFTEIRKAREKRKAPNLSKRLLRNIDLHSEDLLGVNLQGAVLEDCNLEEVNLQGANLLDANLRNLRLFIYSSNPKSKYTPIMPLFFTFVKMKDRLLLFNKPTPTTWPISLIPFADCSTHPEFSGIMSFRL